MPPAGLIALWAVVAAHIVLGAARVIVDWRLRRLLRRAADWWEAEARKAAG